MYKVCLIFLLVFSISLAQSRGKVSIEELDSILTIFSSKSLEDSDMCEPPLMFYKLYGVESGYEQVFDELKKEADQGNTEAQFSLGRMFDIGQGVIENNTRALYWYNRAASQGNLNAQHILGWKYLKGEEVGKDVEKAIEWYTKSAKQRSILGQYSLAKIYEKGEGVAKNIISAYTWMSLASSSDSYLEKDKNDLAKIMTPEQLIQAQKMAQKLSQEIYGNELTFH